MNNNFMGGATNHGNGWMTTHDPRGDIRHYTGQHNNRTNDFNNHFMQVRNVMHEQAHRQQQIDRHIIEREIREREIREREERERVEREQRERLEREQRERRERHEHDVRKSQDDSSSNHLKAVELRRKESDSRSEKYKNEINNVLNLSEDLSENNISVSLSILKEKKTLGEKWLQEIKDLLVIQKNHIPMINAHFDKCVRDVRASDQSNEVKDRLSSRWNELRNTEVSNKKMIMGFSQREINEITHFIKIVDESMTTFNERLSLINKNKADALAENFRFLSSNQLSAKEKQIGTCETVTCEVSAQAKWAAIEASQFTAFGTGMIAGVPAELHDVVKGIVSAVMGPAETVAALKALVNSGNVLGNVSDAIKEKWVTHIDNMVAAQERGGVAGYFEAGVEGGKLLTDVAATGLLGVGAAKTGISILKSGATAGEKVIAKTASFIPGQTSKYPTVKLADTGMKWGEGNPSQGKPFETYYGKTFLPESTQTPKTFQAYDFIDEATGSSVSVKTLDTLTKSRLENPSKLYSSIKDNINDVLKFKYDKKGEFEYYAKDVTSKEVVVGVPAATNEAQWEQINRAIQYGNDNGVKVTIIKVAE